MDKFHDYLSSQQDRLDTDLPDELVWDRIQHTMKEKKGAGSVKYLTRYFAAASVIILVAAGFWLANRKTVHLQKENVAVTPFLSEKDSTSTAIQNRLPVINSRPVETPEEKDESKQVAEQQIEKVSAGYATLISSRLQQVRTTPVYAECTDYFSDFTVQLKQMDKDELNIQQDIDHYGMQDALVEQLIDVYERKLKLLKDLQKQISRMNSKADLRHDTSKQNKPCFINL